ncbi:hypothetical protein BYT27DRAFT_7192842 [Phlegmacium glaucopus]|nr:hypothetical protein BYT27DRAFT_7192842 [Phlegmacium glaucopus]
MADFKVLPDEANITEVSNLEVFDLNGNKVKFGSIFEKQKTVVVFIRHFFCGTCQAYVGHLGTVSEEALEAAGTRIVVIGCGEWNPIKSYAETAEFNGQVFADPSRKLYHALGMNIENLERTPKGEQSPSYVPVNPVGNILRSVWRGPMKNPSHIGKQGNISQLGGDFIFGPGPQCTFASRMKHTEDHLEVSELMKQAGISFP